MIPIIKNKKVYYEYTIIETIIAGIQLAGSEVKAIKNGKASISEAFCIIKEGEIFINQMHVSESKQNVMLMHDPVRSRKLLLKKKEILKLQREVKEKGLTIVPLAILQSKANFIKIEIALVKGKKLYDKKLATKIKDMDRELKN